MLEAFQMRMQAGLNATASMAHQAIQNVDVLFQGEGVPLPPPVILDYIYGISAYKAWGSKSNDGFNQMEAYRNEHYAHIPPPSPAQPRRHHAPTRRGGLDETMDKLNRFLMYIQGITPEMAAERRQKEIEQEERAAQEASRSKVTEWRDRLTAENGVF